MLANLDKTHSVRTEVQEAVQLMNRNIGSDTSPMASPQLLDRHIILTSFRQCKFEEAQGVNPKHDIFQPTRRPLPPSPTRNAEMISSPLKRSLSHSENLSHPNNNNERCRGAPCRRVVRNNNEK